MELRLRARIGAARLVLDQVAGSASHESVSRMQAAAVIELVGSRVTELSSRTADVVVVWFGGVVAWWCGGTVIVWWWCGVVVV